MSEHVFEVESGKAIKMPTKGKVCTEDIIVRGVGGSGDEEMVALFNNTATTLPKAIKELEVIPEYACYMKTNLLEIDLPNTIEMGLACFSSPSTAMNYYKVNLPKAQKVQGISTKNTSETAKTFGLYLPECTSINACTNSPNMVYCILPKITTIGIRNALNQNSKCKLILPQHFFVAHNSSNWGSPTIESVYVPKALLEQYKTGSNWVVYPEKIFAIEDSEEVLQILADVGYTYEPMEVSA